VRLSLALSLALLGAACSRGPAPVHVASVRIAGGNVAAPLREAGLDDSAVEAASREGLGAAGFSLGQGGRPYRADVDVVGVRLVPPDAPGGPPRVEVAVGIELTPTEAGNGGGGRRETGSGTAPLAGGDPRAAWRSALGVAARQAADGLALGFAEEGKPLKKLIADLESRDARVRDHAVRVLADRKSAAAVPAIIERLRDDDRAVVRRAIGALAQIGDERAVAPLIELSQSDDPALTARVARLIGDIGGAEAEGYLLTIESGHPDPRVRAAAREALGELRARAQQAGALSVRK
jgi:HEAT repeat protein